jgi:hypothetical protein
MINGAVTVLPLQGVHGGRSTYKLTTDRSLDVQCACAGVQVKFDCCTNGCANAPAETKRDKTMAQSLKEFDNKFLIK